MMTDKLTAEQWRRAMGKKVATKKSKWQNIRVTDHESGEKYDSKHEMACHKKLLVVHGHQNVIRQPSFPVGNTGERIRPDFMVITGREDGLTFELMDAKGFLAAPWRTKANRFLSLHHVEIECLGKEWLNE